MAPMTSNDTPFTPTDPLMTPGDVAEYLKVTVRTLDAWRYRRTGPAFVHMGRHVRYRQSAVEAFINGLEDKTA